MAALLTGVKDDERDDTMECLTCHKQIQGKTHYKIHLTTPQHLKREEANSINDLGPPPRQLPEWTDILQYLDYLKLDEPIIGLDSLVQQEDTFVDGRCYLNYKCKMCNVDGIMCSMVSHIVSRKHRHRYLQLKRPDLLTQSNGMGQKQPGLVARAKAAIVEKQDGWGTPSAIKEPKEKFRPVTRSMLKQAKQGPKPTQGSHSHAYEASSYGQDWRGQAHLTTDGYRQPDFPNNVFGKPSQFHGNDQNDRPRGDAALWQAYPNTDRPENAYYQDGRPRPYQNEGYKEKLPYLEGDGSVRSFVEGDGSGRHHLDKAIPGSSYRNEHQDQYYPEMDPRRGWNSSGVVQQDLYHGGVPRSRFADTDRSGPAQHPEEMVGQVRGQMYASRDGRGHSMEEMQRPGRSFQNMEKGTDYLQTMIREARAGTYEMQEYAKRGGMGDYAQEHVPHKKKRESRFSDATPKEVELAQRRFKEGTFPPMNQSRGPVQVFEERRALDSMHTAVNSENVLDVLDGVQIDSAEEANFLKQKLCDVLKQFHANKSQRSEVSPSDREYRSDVWMDQRRNAQEIRESARYDRDLRNLTNDSTGVKETWPWPEKNTRDVQDPRYVEDQRPDTRYENRSTDFQESRPYADSQSDFPQARRFKDNPRDFQHGGQFGENRMAFQQERGLCDNSRDVQQAGHFEDHFSAYRQASSFKESSRAGHVEEDPRIFQSMRHTGGTEENRSYEQQFEGAVLGRHGDRDFRRVDAQHEFEWGAQRNRSTGRSDEFKDYHPDAERKAYQEGHWKTRSLREDQAYGENQAHMPHYHVDPSTELYDPFHPSSSPPPAPPPSSLEKLASTLLELVSRN
ncbi:uncharacterized protein si:ch211-13c6.2 isoform X2 [Astyanax mexicanus]|uniref:uncharacterized protein si:ch211-13c6.2 isoform X2 n=1 Tax=Astyanax mexicanus TaxID=7994 RepID=UPI0020CABEC2|nr:uncharacterized protein si:ch211-13c6.2 isoform X2 [Astyanax mexicanus]